MSRTDTDTDQVKLGALEIDSFLELRSLVASEKRQIAGFKRKYDATEIAPLDEAVVHAEAEVKAAKLRLRDAESLASNKRYKFQREFAARLLDDHALHLLDQLLRIRAQNSPSYVLLMTGSYPTVEDAIWHGILGELGAQKQVMHVRMKFLMDEEAQRYPYDSETEYLQFHGLEVLAPGAAQWERVEVSSDNDLTVEILGGLPVCEPYQLRDIQGFQTCAAQTSDGARVGWFSLDELDAYLVTPAMISSTWIRRKISEIHSRRVELPDTAAPTAATVVAVAVKQNNPV